MGGVSEREDEEGVDSQVEAKNISSVESVCRRGVLAPVEWIEDGVR